MGENYPLLKGGIDKLSISDFSEEWVLFLSEKEYEQGESIRRHVDSRLREEIDIQEFISRPKPFSDFSDFINAIKI